MLRGFSDEGVATATEYLLLLAISMTVLTVLFLAFSSFGNAAADDAGAASARLIAAGVSQRISEMVSSPDAGIVAQDMGLPEHINGKAYVVYPCEEGIAVMTNHDRAGKKHTAPLIMPVSGLSVEGFMVSAPQCHRIVYDRFNRTVTLS
jgi:hypothetical protein